MNIKRWEIRILDRSLNRKAFIQSTAGKPPLLSASWSLSRIGGCGDFEMSVPANTLQGTVLNGYILEVYIEPIGGALTLYYTGAIVQIPTAIGKSTATVEVYKAVGLWQQIQRTIISKYYAGKNTEDMVKDILADINGDLDVVSATDQITITTDYPIGDFEGTDVSAASAIKKIAEVQLSVDYGVDQNKKLYFKDTDTAVVERFWVGSHVQQFEPVKRSDRLINHVLVKSKQLVGGGMLTLSREDATSITSYGRRTKVVQNHELRNADDVWRFAQHVLDTSKNPFESTSVEIENFTDFRFPAGKVRITSKKGGTEHELPIEGVRYTLDSHGGLNGKFDIGDEPRIILSDQVAELLREVAISKDSSVSMVQIEHTRGEEWEQDAIVDSRKQGNYNIFTDSFKNTTGLDVVLTSNMWFRRELHYLGCNFDFTKSTVFSNAIEIGQSTDTIRIHADTDFYGRINFISQEDLDDFWDQGASDYVIRDGFAQLKGITNNQDLYYIWNGRVFQLPQDYIINGQIDITTNNSSDGYVIFGWIDGSNYNLFRFKDNLGVPRTETALIKVVAGVPTTLSSNALSAEDDFTFILTVRNTPTNTTCYVEDINDPTDNHTLSAAMTNAANRRCGYKQLRAGGSDVAYADYFELKDIGDVKIFVSRDGGTTFTQATIVHGINNIDVNVSGQPAGTSIVMKAEITHPSRLYGWGFSWKN